MTIQLFVLFLLLSISDVRSASFKAEEVSDQQTKKVSLCSEELLKIIRDGQKPSKGYTPTCDDQGNFDSRQAVVGFLFCVDQVTGEEIEGTRTKVFEPLIQCPKDKTVKGKCGAQRIRMVEKAAKARAQGHELMDYVPVSCDSDGNYNEKQTNGFATWCVDKITGERKECC